MGTHGVTIYLDSNDFKNDLQKIFLVISEHGKQSSWKISNAECIGESTEILHQASDDGRIISGLEFYQIVAEITQILDGVLEAFQEDIYHKWLLIRAIHGYEFDIETKDTILLQRIQENFKFSNDLIY